MAGRFLSSRMSRSRNLLGAYVSASARAVALVTRPASSRAGAPVSRPVAARVGAGAPATRPSSGGGVRTLGDISDKAILHASTAVPKNRGSHGYECGIRTLNNLHHGGSAHPSTASDVLVSLLTLRQHILHILNNLICSLLGFISNGPCFFALYAARYFNTLSCSCAAAKTSTPTTGLPSIIISRMKPTFSSCSSNKDNCSLEAKMAAWEVEWKAERAASAAKWHAANSAFKTESEAWIAETAADNAAFSRYLSIIMVLWGFSGICWIRKLYSGSSRSGTSSSKGKRESCGVAGVVDADVH